MYMKIKAILTLVAALTIVTASSAFRTQSGREARSNECFARVAQGRGVRAKLLAADDSTSSQRDRDGETRPRSDDANRTARFRGQDDRAAATRDRQDERLAKELVQRFSER